MYAFDQYGLRPVTEQDRAHCAAWIKGDPDHYQKMTADFFINPEPGMESFAVVNPAGETVFYFRQMRALRIDIQFGPSFTEKERAANREALTKGCTWLREMAQAAGIRQVMFQTDSPELALFCKRRLDFHASPGEMLSHIPAPLLKQPEEKPAQPLQQGTQERG